MTERNRERNRASQEHHVIELHVHRSNLEKGGFTRAHAARLVDKWLAKGLHKSDPFIRNRSISQLMNGVATPEDF